MWLRRSHEFSETKIRKHFFNKVHIFECEKIWPDPLVTHARSTWQVVSSAKKEDNIFLNHWQTQNNILTLPNLLFWTTRYSDISSNLPQLSCTLHLNLTCDTGVSLIDDRWNFQLRNFHLLVDEISLAILKSHL
jgi:hypothetical protein